MSGAIGYTRSQKADAGPPMRFDHGLFWYTESFDPADDICCAPDCRMPIDENDVPLMLFATRAGLTWQSRLHVSCAERLGVTHGLTR